MDFFIEIAAQKKNILIETHSDHIITLLRRRVAEKVISTSDANIFFVTQQPDGKCLRNRNARRTEFYRQHHAGGIP